MSIFLFGLASGFLVGAGLEADFERDAAREIASRLEGPAKVHVDARTNLTALWGEVASVTIRASDFSTPALPFFTEPQRSTRGKVSRVHLRLKEFTLAGLRVAEIDATIPGCRFDLGLATRKRQFRLSRSGVGTGSVVIRADDLVRYVLGKFPEIKTMTLQLRNGRALMEGDAEILILQTKYRIDAALTSPDGSTFALSDARITFDGNPADPISADALLRTLNPVIDLNKDLKLYGAVHVRQVSLANDELRASGDTRIPNLPDPPSGGTL